MKKAELFGALFLTAVSLQVVMVAKANAQETLMTSLDLDKDGYITLKEASSNVMLLKSFGAIDTNEDGRLSVKELNESKLDVTSLKSTKETQAQVKKVNKVSG